MRGTVDVEKGADGGPLGTPQLTGVVGQKKKKNRQDQRVLYHLSQGGGIGQQYESPQLR